MSGDWLDFDLQVSMFLRSVKNDAISWCKKVTNHQRQQEKIARLEAENKSLRSQSRLLQAILDNAPLLISAKCPKGRVLFTNPRFNVLQGPPPQEYIGRSVFELFPKNIAEQLWQNDLKAQQSPQPILAEEQVSHRDGKLHTYHTTKFRLLEEDGGLMGTCAISIDITDSKQLEFDAYHDFLTGLYNHRYFAENLERDLSRAHRSQSILVVALIDLDNFKAVNDNFGHNKGDSVLKVVAHSMNEHFHRADDLCFRLGGDEFAIVFAIDEESKALGLVEQLRKQINGDITVELGGADFAVTCSIGVHMVKPSENVSHEQLYSRIDRALYQVKRSGKNAVSLI